MRTLRRSIPSTLSISGTTDTGIRRQATRTNWATRTGRTAGCTMTPRSIMIARHLRASQPNRPSGSSGSSRAS